MTAMSDEHGDTYPVHMRRRTLSEALEYVARDIQDHPERYTYVALAVLLGTFADQARELENRPVEPRQAPHVPPHGHPLPCTDPSNCVVCGDAAPTMAGDRRWLVWSHQHEAWWKPGSRGYTGDLDAAGRFTAREAADICVKASHAWMRGVGDFGDRDASPPPPEVRILAPQFKASGLPHEAATAADGVLMAALATARVREATREALRAKEMFVHHGGDAS